MLEYKDAKATIKVQDKDGKELMDFTTWRSDFIHQILLGGNCLGIVSAGDKVVISIEINKISKPENLAAIVADPANIGC
jgi:hypothetical protein